VNRLDKLAEWNMEKQAAFMHIIVSALSTAQDEVAPRLFF
jgi:hypothetical protein